MAKSNRVQNTPPVEHSEKIDFSDTEKLRKQNDRDNGIHPTLFIDFQSIEVGQQNIDMTTEEYIQFITSNSVEPNDRVWITDEFDRILTTFDGEKLKIHWAVRQNLVLRGDSLDIP